MILLPQCPRIETNIFSLQNYTVHLIYTYVLKQYDKSYYLCSFVVVLLNLRKQHYNIQGEWLAIPVNSFRKKYKPSGSPSLPQVNHVCATDCQIPILCI